jgi:hypothetical protein
MTVKIFFKSLGKALNPSRAEEYYGVLARRFYSKLYRAEINILNKCKGLPEYVYRVYLASLKATRLHTYTNDFDELKGELISLDKKIKRYNEYIDNSIFLINDRFPKNRKNIDFKYVKFLKVTDCQLGRYIGYVAYVSERGNETDFHFIGKFFDKNGVAVELNEIDKTYLVEPITNNEEFTQYINLYSKELSKKPLGTQQAELSLLYDAWNVQQNYLTQKENEEGNM